MSVTDQFDNWFKGLTTTQKRDLLKYIFDNLGMRNVNEGLFAGPSGDLAKGLFAGPGGSSQGRCPLCGR